MIYIIDDKNDVITIGITAYRYGKGFDAPVCTLQSESHRPHLAPLRNYSTVYTPDTHVRKENYKVINHIQLYVIVTRSVTLTAF